jgi:hypothetical protein
VFVSTSRKFKFKYVYSICLVHFVECVIILQFNVITAAEAYGLFSRPESGEMSHIYKAGRSDRRSIVDFGWSANRVPAFATCRSPALIGRLAVRSSRPTLFQSWNVRCLASPNGINVCTTD